jgi:hypothetical protein
MLQIVAAFPGVGKTTLQKSNPAILDSDSSTFDKAGFPRNYLGHIAAMTDVGKLMLVSSHEPVRQGLTAQGSPYILAYPEPAAKEEYLTRYLNRGSPLAFRQLLADNWDAWLASCQEQEGCTHVVLQPSQFLSDVIAPAPGSSHWYIKPGTPSRYKPRRILGA